MPLRRTRNQGGAPAKAAPRRRKAKPTIDYTGLFEERARLVKLQHATEMLTLGVKKPRISVSKAWTAVQPLLDRCNVDRAEFRRRLSECLQGKAPTRELATFIGDRIQQVDRIVAVAPAGIEKAEQCLRGLMRMNCFDEVPQLYDALLLPAFTPVEHQVVEIAQLWKQTERSLRLAGRSPGYLWVGQRSEYDTMNAASFYRFAERFGLDEFQLLFDTVEEVFRQALLSEYGGLHAHLPDTHSVSVAHDLWLLSRCPRLATRLRYGVEFAIDRVIGQQLPTGAWGYVGGDDATPDQYFTAVATAALLRASSSERVRAAALRGVQQLATLQMPDGSWGAWGRAAKQEQPDLLTTLFAVDALCEAQDGRFSHPIARGQAWIKLRQTETGVWDAPEWPWVSTTVFALELLSRAPADRVSRESMYLRAARSLLRNAREESLRDNAGSRRLAVIAAYHGLEALLYAALKERGAPVFRTEKGKHNETIGFQGALRAYGEAVEESKRLPGYDILERLRYRRDQVVHKADDPGDETAEVVDGALRYGSALTRLAFDSAL